MENKFKYGFWIWKNKLDPILSILSHLADYELSELERNAIRLELKDTNDEKGIWSDYILNGSQNKIKLKFAYDDEERTDMIHLRIETSIELKEKIEFMNFIQAMFKELIE